jgi:hypothetical protein
MFTTRFYYNNRLRTYLFYPNTHTFLENKITGRDSQGAGRQDELIGGKPPVVK